MLGYQPLSIVENPGFIEYTNKLNPLYKLPSRQILSNNLLSALYNDKIQDIKHIKQQLKLLDYVSLTTNIWQLDSNNSYISVTCHFISKQKLNSIVLATRELN